MDLIDRQTAIEAIEQHKIAVLGECKWDEGIAYGYAAAHRHLVEIVKQLPSAERRGRWIDGKRISFDGTFHWFRQCSECLYEREDDTPEKDTNYCPNCGSRMDLEGDAE